MAKFKNMKNKTASDFDGQETSVVDTNDNVPFRVFYQEETSNNENEPDYTYNNISLYFYQELVDPREYAELIWFIRRLKKEDQLHVFIDSPGGDLDTLCALCHAFMECPAHITCHADGSAFSAAAILAFVGDDIVINEYASFMWHDVSICIKMKESSNTTKMLECMSKTYRDMLETYCSSVLTSKEIDDIVFDGKTFFLTAQQCIERMKNSNKMKEITPEEQEKSS